MSRAQEGADFATHGDGVGRIGVLDTRLLNRADEQGVGIGVGVCRSDRTDQRRSADRDQGPSWMYHSDNSFADLN